MSGIKSAATKAVKAASLATLERRLSAAGAEILGATNPYEILRFRTNLGVGIIHTGKRGQSWNPEALAAKAHLDGNKGSLAPVAVKGRRKDKATVTALLERDGDGCFFCGHPLGSDVTVEHLVAVAHGGPNHVSNLFLAHSECNNSAGHMSAPEKVRLAISQRIAS